MATHVLAGEVGADLLFGLAVEMYPDWLRGEDQLPTLIEATVAALPPQAAAVAVDRLADPSEEVEANDEEQARFWVESVAPGDDCWPLFEFCERRARRLVARLGPLILGLVPALVARSIMTGPDLEAAIASLELERSPQCQPHGPEAPRGYRRRSGRAVHDRRRVHPRPAEHAPVGTPHRVGVARIP
jgi:hypothetical protein